jgi:hypothetical protein
MDWMSWKTWSLIGLIIVALALYAFAATQSARTAEPAPNVALPSPRTPARTSTAAPGVGSVHMEWLDMPSGSYKSERNLFAYKEPPPPPPQPAPQPVVPVPVPVPVPVQPIEPPAPVPPPFPYKYIGTFGTPENPIATFSGNGEIINVRVGETMDGKFILRSIGIESVEIGFVGFPPDAKTRIPLGQ